MRIAAMARRLAPGRGQRSGHPPGVIYLLVRGAGQPQDSFRAAEAVGALSSGQSVTPDKEVIAGCMASVCAAGILYVLVYWRDSPRVRNDRASLNE